MRPNTSGLFQIKVPAAAGIRADLPKQEGGDSCPPPPSNGLEIPFPCSLRSIFTTCQTLRLRFPSSCTPSRDFEPALHNTCA